MTTTDPITEYSIVDLEQARDIIATAFDEHTDVDIAIRRAIARIMGADPQTDDVGELLLEFLTDINVHLKLLAAKPPVAETSSVARTRLLKAAEDANSALGNTERARVYLELANAYTLNGDGR